MAMQEKEATVKDDTSGHSKRSKAQKPNEDGNRKPFREDAPQIRTKEAFAREYEQLIDAIKRGSMTPKQMEQFNTALKGARYFQFDLELSMLRLVMKYKGTFVPQSPVLKELMPKGLLADGRVKRLG